MICFSDCPKTQPITKSSSSKKPAAGKNPTATNGNNNNAGNPVINLTDEDVCETSNQNFATQQQQSSYNRNPGIQTILNRFHSRNKNNQGAWKRRPQYRQYQQHQQQQPMNEAGRVDENTNRNPRNNNSSSSEFRKTRDEKNLNKFYNRNQRQGAYRRNKTTGSYSPNYSLLPNRDKFSEQRRNWAETNFNKNGSSNFTEQIYENSQDYNRTQRKSHPYQVRNQILERFISDSRNTNRSNRSNTNVIPNRINPNSRNSEINIESSNENSTSTTGQFDNANKQTNRKVFYRRSKNTKTINLADPEKEKQNRVSGNDKEYPTINDNNPIIDLDKNTENNRAEYLESSTKDNTEVTPRIRVIPLSKLLNRENTSNLTENSNEPANVDKNTTIEKPIQQKKRPSRKISNPRSDDIDKLVETVSKMDKNSIISIINRNDNKYSKALLMSAHKRVNEEISKRLKEYNLTPSPENPTNFELTPDQIVNDIDVPNVLLNEIQKMLRISIETNEAATLAGKPTTDEDAMTVTTSTMMSLPNDGLNVTKETLQNPDPSKSKQNHDENNKDEPKTCKIENSPAKDPLCAELPSSTNLKDRLKKALDMKSFNSRSRNIYQDTDKILSSSSSVSSQRSYKSPRHSTSNSILTNHRRSPEKRGASVTSSRRQSKSPSCASDCLSKYSLLGSKRNSSKSSTGSPVRIYYRSSSSDSSSSASSSNNSSDSKRDNNNRRSKFHSPLRLHSRQSNNSRNHSRSRSQSRGNERARLKTHPQAFNRSSSRNRSGSPLSQTSAPSSTKQPIKNEREIQILNAIEHFEKLLLPLYDAKTQNRYNRIRNFQIKGKMNFIIWIITIKESNDNGGHSSCKRFTKAEIHDLRSGIFNRDNPWALNALISYMNRIIDDKKNEIATQQDNNKTNNRNVDNADDGGADGNNVFNADDNKDKGNEANVISQDKNQNQNKSANLAEKLAAQQTSNGLNVSSNNDDDNEKMQSQQSKVHQSVDTEARNSNAGNSVKSSRNANREKTVNGAEKLNENEKNQENSMLRRQATQMLTNDGNGEYTKDNEMSRNNNDETMINNSSLNGGTTNESGSITNSAATSNNNNNNADNIRVDVGDMNINSIHLVTQKCLQMKFIAYVNDFNNTMPNEAILQKIQAIVLKMDESNNHKIFIENLIMKLQQDVEKLEKNVTRLEKDREIYLKLLMRNLTPPNQIRQNPTTTNLQTLNTDIFAKPINTKRKLLNDFNADNQEPQEFVERNSLTNNNDHLCSVPKRICSNELNISNTNTIETTTENIEENNAEQATTRLENLENITTSNPTTNRNMISTAASSFAIDTSDITTSSISDAALLLNDVNDIPVGCFDAINCPVSQICISEPFVYAATENGSVLKYNMHNFELLASIQMHFEAITQMLFCKKSKLLYTTSLDGVLKITSIENLAAGFDIHLHEPLESLAIEWDTAFIGTRWGKIYTCCDLSQKSSSLTTLYSTESSIISIKATKEGPRKILIVAIKGNHFQMHDAKTGLLLRKFDIPEGHFIYSILFDGDYIYCGSTIDEVYKYDFATGNFITGIKSGKGGVCMRLYKNRYILVGCYDGFIYVLDIETNKQICRFRGAGEIILTLEIVGNMVISTAKNNSMKMLNIPQLL